MCDIAITDQLVTEHLRSNDIYCEDRPWIIEKSPLGDRGLFATKDILPGEIIFVDYPIVIGPRVKLEKPSICVSCYKNHDLKNCTRNCGLPVCSDRCQDSSLHKKECELITKWQNGTKPVENTGDLLKCLTPIRALILSPDDKRFIKVLKSHDYPNHGVEVDILKRKLNLNIGEEESEFMLLACSVLDANAFEVIVGNETRQGSLRGLFPLASLVNHNCTPNTMHVFNSKHQIISRAAVFIPKGSEIFDSYARLTWGTLVRRFNLLTTKHFCCTCERCRDPSEFGGNLNGVNCERCKGIVLPVNPLKTKTEWSCTKCKSLMPKNKVALINSVLGSRLKSFDDHENDVDGILKFLKEKLASLVPEFHQVAIETKYKLVWALGYNDGYTWEELTQELLDTKEQMCRDLLKLLKTIRIGLCKMRGLLLYELYCCLKEKRRRSLLKTEHEINNNAPINETEIETEIENIFEECLDILKYDVGAPEEIKLANENPTSQQSN